MFEEGKEFYQKAKKIMSDAEFELRKWKTDNKGLHKKEVGAVV